MRPLALSILAMCAIGLASAEAVAQDSGATRATEVLTPDSRTARAAEALTPDSGAAKVPEPVAPNSGTASAFDLASRLRRSWENGGSKVTLKGAPNDRSAGAGARSG